VVKNEWDNISTTPIRLHVLDWDNLTLFTFFTILNKCEFIFIVAPCILFQFTKKNQQMHLKIILKTHTKTLKSPYMFRSTTILRVIHGTLLIINVEIIRKILR
jgi:hypothetical protein